MSFHKMKFFWITGAFFGLLFAVLFSVRMDLFRSKASHELEKGIVASTPADRDSWMNIFQGGRKIGFSHTVFSKKEKGYDLKETVFMRINTLGMVQGLNLRTESVLNPDFTLSSIDFEISSGRFRFGAEGAVSGDTLSLKTKTRSSGDTRTIDIKLSKKPYLAAGIMYAARAADAKPGDTFFFEIFDPATMSQGTADVNILNKEEILNMGVIKSATKVTVSFKGATQMAWIGENGEVLKEEGLLGIILEKTTREDALSELALESSQDLTQVASVESNVRIDDPLQLLLLKIEISGINYDNVHISGGRQTLEGNILLIHKESLSDIQTSQVPENLKVFLEPTPFIQSDHKKIRNLMKEIVSPDDTPLEKAEKLMSWVYKNIEKRPVLSLPDAISTLENRMGDCNEHAVLFAALARAAGIPAKVEAGLVYLKGRFYYHAWNILYLGNWITADSLFGQIPADVTHIRFATGEQQLDLISIMGKVKLKIIGF